MPEGTTLAWEDRCFKPTDQWSDGAGNQWSYCLDEDGTCVICGVVPTGSTLEVPARIAEHEVAAIAADACANLAELRRVTLPPTVRFIGQKAFAYCANLEDVAFSEGLVAIGKFAFMNGGLRSLRTPSTLKSIGDKAFFHCTNLTEVQLNEGLISLGTSAFAQTSVSELYLPASVEAVGLHVLQPWEAGDEVRLVAHPDNASYSTDSAGAALYRREPEGLVLIDFLGHGKRYEVLPGTTAIGPNAFAQHPNLEEVVLPEGLLEIGTGAFRSCSGIAAITLPSTLTTIGPRAFIGTNLQAITLPAALDAIDSTSLLIYSGSSAAKNLPPLVIRVDAANPRFYVEGGVVCKREEDGEVRAVMYAGEEPVVRIPENVTRISSCLFYGVTGINELFVHEGVGHFGVEAFVTGLPISTIHLALSEPVEGHDTIDVHFSPTPQARQSFMTAFSGGTLDPVALIEAADQGLMFYSDQYEMGRATLERLEDPVLADSSRDRYLRRLLNTRLKSVTQDFARHNYQEGFDRLADQGILTAANIEDVMGYAREAGGVATVGYLLEMKHARFGASPMDAYEL